MKSYESMSEKDLLCFHEDCLRAAMECPQFRQDPFEPEDILLGDVDKEVVLDYWATEDTLWDAGYFVELSKESRIILELYREELIKRKIKALEEEEDW